MGSSRPRTAPTLLVTLVLGALVAGGCATRYQPRASSGGYSDTRLDAARFQVEFQGNEETPRDVVYGYLLYRCAELTVEAGYRDFVIMEFTGHPTIYILQEMVHGPGDRVVTQYWGKHAATAVIAMSSDDDLPPGSARLEAKEAIRVIRGERMGLVSGVFGAKDVLRHWAPLVKR